jgi:hypothetical protein
MRILHFAIGRRAGAKALAVGLAVGLAFAGGVPASAAQSNRDGTRLVLVPTLGDGWALDLPQPPAGTHYAKIGLSDGPGNGLALRSDGVVIAVGEQKTGAWGIPGLPPGVRYVDMEAYGGLPGDPHAGLLLRSDGGLVPLGQFPAKWISEMPKPPAGVRYTAFLGSSNILLRSDGRAVYFEGDLTVDCDAPGYWATHDECPGLVEVMPHRDYVDAARGEFGLLFLRANGKVDVLNLYGRSSDRASDSAPGGDGYVPESLRIPKLPSGVRYVSVAAWDWVSLLVRSDGEVVVLGEDERSKTSDPPVVPPLPKGLKYTSGVFGDGYALLTRSDGEVVVAPRSKPKKSDRSAWAKAYRKATAVPQLPKGSVFTGVDVYWGDGLEIVCYSVRDLASGETARSSVASAKAAGPVVKGKAAKVKVVVQSRAAVAGGKVRIWHKGKAIGTAKASKSGSATVRIRTGTFAAGKKNKVVVQFLGKGQARKSSKTPAVIRAASK